ncbi:MAG TPA: DegQ family serine endoprotease [Deferrisomatales bacterium]|nr:DegQ family serine endoprotease [Deferrisomatales bacterium]
MTRKPYVPGATLAVATFLAAAAWATPAPESFAPLAEKLQPSVVNISTTSSMKHPGMRGNDPNQERLREFFGDEFFRQFFGGDAPHPGFKSQSLGSGFILDREGYVITNNHVVENADEILVRLSDEHEFKAQVVGTDPKTDLALIRFEPKGETLHPVALGDSDAVKIGDWVVAIGNPFGYGHTVTAGIVSAKGRLIGAGPYDNFLQTDAAINPGNSGGPLFDMQGRVVGINSAIVAGGTGIGFAIPVNLAKEVVSQLKDKGTVTRGWLGVMIQEVSPELAKQFGLEEARGALVAEVTSGGPAEKGGLQRGDVILTFDGVSVDKMNQLPRLVAQREPGKKVEVGVLRRGEKKTLSVALGELKGDAVAGEPGTAEELGLTVQELTPELRKQLDLGSDGGLIVAGVDADGAGEKAGLRRGDVLLEVNQTPVPDLSSYRKVLADAKGKDSVLFLVKRGEGSRYLVVSLGK